MIPIRDVGPRLHGSPGLTWLLIAANVLAFFWMSRGGEVRQQTVTLRFAAVPANVIGSEPVVWALAETLSPAAFGWFQGAEIVAVPAELSAGEFEEYVVQELRKRGQRVRDYAVVEPALPGWATLLSSMFMHGGWAHLLGNMVFLFVFGARLEDRLGRVRYLLFYVLTGVAAALSHVVSDPASAIPMVGASGAISGLLGGYVVLWPHGRILTLVPFFGFLSFQELPAFLFIAIWVVMQLFLIAGPSGAGGGVAVWAHLGGFLYGLALIFLFDPLRRGRRRADSGAQGASEAPPHVRRPDGWFDDRRNWP